jgi:thiol-disulfide isomerase/thioredoxin
MKKTALLFALLLIVGVITYSFREVPAKKEFSKESLSATLLSTDGSQVAFKDILKKQKDKITVIEVWASWCGDCVKAMPKVKELQEKNKNVSFVFISMDKTADKWKDGIQKHELKGAQYMANDGMKGVFGQAIDLDWIPRYIIIDATGKIIVYRAIETDFDQINTTLQQLQL